MIDRKADARRKIQLGGLIVKAGLDEEPAAVLLGLLLDAAGRLAGPGGEAARERWLSTGAGAFAADTNKR